MPRGIFVGLSTIDLVYNVESFPAANSKVAAQTQKAFVGGPATNAAITFSHLGGDATLVTTVGSHPLADLIHNELQQYSIQLEDLHSSFEELPVISSICVNSVGERNVVSANAARIQPFPAQIREEVLEQASILVVDGHYMQACQAWAQACRQRSIQVVLDGGSWKAGMEELLKNVDVAICSTDFHPPGCATEAEVIKYLKHRGLSKIAITRGADPIRFISQGIAGVVPIPQVNQIDTMGAGDIFHGAFCYYSAQSHGFVEALAEAAGIAAESCRHNGTREWMKTSASI